MYKWLETCLLSSSNTSRRQAFGQLQTSCWIQFGVTNEISCFQIFIDKFIVNNILSGMFIYLDNITVCGKIKNINLNRFSEAAEKFNLTYNHDKYTFSETFMNLMGYIIISECKIKPDLQRCWPLKELPLPQDMNSLCCISSYILILFSLDCQFIWVDCSSHTS